MSRPFAALDPDPQDLAEIEAGLRLRCGVTFGSVPLARLAWELVAPLVIERIGVDVVAATEAKQATRAEAFEQLRTMLAECEKQRAEGNDCDGLFGTVAADFIGAWENEHEAPEA